MNFRSVSSGGRQPVSRSALQWAPQWARLQLSLRPLSAIAPATLLSALAPASELALASALASAPALARPGLARRLSTMSAFGFALSGAGCASLTETPLHDEQIAYHVFNATDAPVIHAPQLHTDQADPVLLYANVQSSRTGTATGNAGSWVRAETGGESGATAPVGYAAYDPFGKRLPGFITPSLWFNRGTDEVLPILPRPLAGVFRAAPPGHTLPATVRVQWREPAAPGQDRRAGRLHGPYRYALRAALPAPVLTRLRQSWRYRLEIAFGVSAKSPRVYWRLGEQTDQGMATIEQGNFTAIQLHSARAPVPVQ